VANAVPTIVFRMPPTYPSDLRPNPDRAARHSDVRSASSIPRPVATEDASASG
jgi:hypothetical protein